MTTDDPKRRKKGPLTFLLVLVLAALAALYARCTGKLGLGGGDGDGDGDDDGRGRGAERATRTPAAPGAHPDFTPPVRCRLRLDASGLTREGTALTAAQAVIACRSGAELIVTGDARDGELAQVRAAFEQASVPLLLSP